MSIPVYQPFTTTSVAGRSAGPTDMTPEVSETSYPLRLGDQPDGEGGDIDTDRETGVVTRTRPKTQRPSRYRVLILNDDYTPMEFVVFVLERFFNKNRAEATRVMLHVHNFGVGVCGIYSHEVAETKVAQVMELARRNEHPLQCTMEKEE